MSVPLLEFRGFSVEARTPTGRLRILEDVWLRLEPGRTLAVVGESGSGKSTLALSLLGLLPPALRVGSGSVLLEGRDVSNLSPAEARELRGGRIGIVFQDTGAALNPAMQVGRQISEVHRAHSGAGSREANQRAMRALAEVGLTPQEERFRCYPHELSGGMRQRVLLAMALAGDPSLLVADEPTASLDPTVQIEILQLIRSLVSERGMGLLLVSHDFGAVAALCDEVAVLCSGRLVESGPRKQVLDAPRHPYTASLVRSVTSQASGEGGGRLGAATDPSRSAAGCPFFSRCQLAMPDCRDSAGPLREVAERHWVACEVVSGNRRPQRRS